MVQLHFDVRDLFRAARLGWSLKKMWVAFCGLLAHYVVYAGCAYAGLALSQGASFRELWAQHGFFPEPTPTPIYYVGAVLAFFILLVTSCAICRITYQRLKGDAFYASGEAWKFTRSCWRSVVFGPLLIFALLALFLACGALIGVVGRYIPALGELSVAISFFPIFFAALIALFIAFSLLVALLFAPAIVGTVQDDALEVVIQSFSLLWSQPWRLLLYYAGVLVTVKIGAFILGCLTFYALYLINAVCGLAMGEKLSAMMLVALQYVPDDLIAFFFTGGVLPYPDLLARFPDAAWPSGSLLWAGRLLAVSLLLVVGFILSYILSAHSAGITLIYLILRKKKDGEDLLEREDEEEQAAEKRPETDAAKTADAKGEGDEQKGSKTGD
ncbi:hypothetical protein HYY27_01415 [bacterium]|nr:hypothetical protein [bacterium]